jgi:hypothetical protein
VYIREIVYEEVDWIHMAEAQDRDQWRVLVKKLQTFGFHKRRRIS